MAKTNRISQYKRSFSLSPFIFAPFTELSSNRNAENDQTRSSIRAIYQLLFLSGTHWYLFANSALHILCSFLSMATERILQNDRLLWVDSNIGQNDADTRKILQELRSVAGHALERDSDGAWVTTHVRVQKGTEKQRWGQVVSFSFKSQSKVLSAHCRRRSIVSSWL